MSIGIRCPGPKHVFARFRNNSTAFYVGTCVTAPEDEITNHDIPVMNDIGGRSVAFQVIQDGSDAFVALTMNRFDYALVQSLRGLRSGPAKSLLGNGGLNGDGSVGQEVANARGTLLLGLNDWQYIEVNEYFGTPAQGVFAGLPDLIPARIFSSAKIDKYKESTVGTRVLEIAMLVKFENIYNPSDLSFSGGSGLTLKGLYSEVAANVGTLAPYNV